MTGISVIICCYNSAERLPDTLKYMSQQQVDPTVAWELIIVDNNSSDNTAEVSRTLWTAHGAPAPLLVVEEKKPGLSNAREAGVKASQYDLILFCDDDNWLDPDYLQQASNIMRANPEIGVLGGLNRAVSSVELPEWFREFEVSYACGPQAEQDGEISSDRLFVAGAGMIIRKGIFRELEEIGFKSQLTDRKGAELMSGGDTEICVMAAMLGHKLYYSSKLKLQHFMEPKRLTWDYYLKLSKGHAKSSYQIIFYKKIYNNEKLPQHWFSYFLNRSRTVFNREVAINMYNYFVKSYKSIGDKESVHRVWDFELWKAHLDMLGKYSQFIHNLEEIRAIKKASPRT